MAHAQRRVRLNVACDDKQRHSIISDINLLRSYRYRLADHYNDPNIDRPQSCYRTSGRTYIAIQIGLHLSSFPRSIFLDFVVL
jgi:hypothetical protein